MDYSHRKGQHDPSSITLKSFLHIFSSLPHLNVVKYVEKKFDMSHNTTTATLS